MLKRKLNDLIEQFGQWGHIAEPIQSLADNPERCNNPLQNQQLSCHSETSTSSATHAEHPDISQIAQLFSSNVFYRNSIDDVFKVYICSYTYQGHNWSTYIQAPNLEDAQNRLKALGQGKVDGELYTSIPIPIKASRAIRIWNWLRGL